MTVQNADTTAPTVSVTAPAAGSTVSGTVTVSATASDNVGVAGVQFLLDGVALGAEDTTAPYSVSWNTTATANGSHTLTARARDAAGNQTTSPAVAVTVQNADTTAPTVSVTAPAAGSTVSGTVTVSATASDNVGVAGVQFLLDGVALGAEDTTAPYSVSWNTTTTANGSHTLTARARDAAGNQTTSPAVAVTVQNADTTAPTVSVTAPAAGSTVSGTVTVSATASDNVGVAGVQFLLDGVALGAEDTTAPYSVSWNTTATANGSHTLTARARDAAGNQTTSSAVSVTVQNGDTTAPTVSVTAPAAGSTVSGTVTVSATASDNVGVAGVQFLLDGVALGAEDATAPYSVSWNTTATANGSHTLTARARDAAGNQTTSAAVSVTVQNGDTTAPTVSVTAPAAGSTVSGTVTVSATASDNVGVAGVQFLLDGVALGAEDATAPYSVSWNTTATANGSHTLTARARDAAGNQTTSAAVSVTVQNGDTTAPTVSVTAPAAGSTVSGTVTVSATASDNVGVAGVQFLLDGVALGAEDATAPYSVSWNTTATANGSHTLTARARDAAGNQTTSAAVAATVANVAAGGLVAAYGFEEGAGSAVGDASGLGNAGTISGATWVTAGKYGKALSFNGTSSLVTVNDTAALHLTTAMTLEAWVRPSASASWRSVLLKETSNGLAYGLYASNASSRPAGFIHIGADIDATGPTAIALNAWTHLAASYDGAAFRLYVNGSQVTSRAVSGSVATSTSPLRLGGNTIWGEYFAGVIDEVRIYNRALSAAEVQADMNTPVSAGAVPQ